MKKMVEVEYVGVKDLSDIMCAAKSVMELGHYVSVSFSNYERTKPLVSVIIRRKDIAEEYDFCFYESSDWNDEYSIQQMNECKSILYNILAQED